jgi:GT2 family glycosyltransferase
MPLVSVIIINYNTFELTSNCIRSVIAFTKNTPYEIILVDNASTEKTPELFLNEFPSITLIRSPKNGGFAYGNNLGIEKAKGEIILLLNSDTLLTEDSIAFTATYLDKNAKTGVVGCRMIFPDQVVQYSARKFRSLGWELLDLFRFIPYMMSYKKRAALMLGKYFKHDEDIQADWINGAFFMFSKSILAKLPGQKLDDRFFMYGEDHLWCWQIKSLGYSIDFIAGTTIIHINSGSTSMDRQLALRKVMRQNEREIMRLRKGQGIYYLFFNLVYSVKEVSRNLIKKLWYKSSGKLLR